MAFEVRAIDVDLAAGVVHESQTSPMSLRNAVRDG